MITRILQLSGRVASNAWVEIGVGADADILVADRGGKREERATFGRRAPGQQRSINTQEPEWLGRVDLAIWETQRCLIPLCGFVCAASADGATSATWLSQDGGALYAAGLRNVMDIGGRLQGVLVAGRFLDQPADTTPVMRRRRCHAMATGQWRGGHASSAAMAVGTLHHRSRRASGVGQRSACPAGRAGVRGAGTQ